VTEESSRRSAALYIVVASTAFAMAAPLARWARPLDPVAIAFGRCALAAAILIAVDFRAAIATARSLSPRTRRAIALAGALLAVHFALFLGGLDRTSIPAALSLVSLEPLAVVLVAWIVHGIRPSRIEGIGVVAASIGAAIVARGAGQGEHRLLGDALVVGAVVLFGFYVAVARAVRNELPARHYAAFVYGSLVAVLGLTLLPTIVGHTMVQTAARSLPPAVVGLASPGETVLGIAIGAIALGAFPTWLEIAGGATVVAGARRRAGRSAGTTRRPRTGSSRGSPPRRRASRGRRRTWRCGRSRCPSGTGRAARPSPARRRARAPRPPACTRS
jgi:drug/metabolite transporter (DMT)-like permease